jgi:hypothetical protein
LPLAARTATRFESWARRVLVGRTQSLSTGDQALAANPHEAGHPSVQGVPTSTSICVDDHPYVSHPGVFGHQPRSNPVLAVHAARLLQVPAAVAETFAAPFFTRLDPGEGAPLRAPVVSAPHGAHS